AAARPHERERHAAPGLVTEPLPAPRGRHVARHRRLEDVLVLLLADLPVDLAADRDLLVLANVERADDRFVLDHLPGVVVLLRALVLLLLLEREGRRAVPGHLAVGAGHDLAAIEVRHLLAVRQLLARCEVIAAHPAARDDLDPLLVAALPDLRARPRDPRI